MGLTKLYQTVPDALDLSVCNISEKVKTNVKSSYVQSKDVRATFMNREYV